jgi:hypothetical protein
VYNVEKLRIRLKNCVQCSEGREGGYSVGLSIDSEGHFFSLKGHDAPTIEFTPQAPSKKFDLHLRVRASDWPITSNEAFFNKLSEPFFTYSNDPKGAKITQQILDCLNKRAREARSLSEKMTWPRIMLNQAWFMVMICPKMQDAETSIFN